MQQIHPNLNENQLVEMLVDGNEKAFRFFYDRYRNRIYRLALRYLKDEVDAQEVVQEVFIKFWEHRDKIRTGSPVEGWIVTMAKNHLLNKLKKQAAEWKLTNNYKHVKVSLDNSLEEKIQESDYNLFLKNTLQTLTDKQLMVYTLARKENLSYFQIAEQLSISVLTVKTHMSRALCHIRGVIHTQKIFS